MSRHTGKALGHSQTPRYGRRSIIVAFATLLLASKMTGAQQGPPKIPRVGILTPAVNGATPNFEALRQGLGELGYAEGQNIILEYRFARENFAALPGLAGELARLPVDVIVTDGGAATDAASKATRTIPIVMAAGDPAIIGLELNLARPGGNITGFSLMNRELNAKRVDLVRTAFPDATSLTALVNPSKVISKAQFQFTVDAARSLGFTVTRVEAASPEALHALSPETLGRPGIPLILLPDVMFWNHRREILALVAAAHVPAIYDAREYADDGGLMAYGTNYPDNFRRAAGYVDRILKGAKPGDLPIQQPVKFDFIVNLKTAKALGLTVPPSILARASEVIE